MEACNIIVYVNANNAVDVAAPMQQKELCYDILRDAKTVIDRSPVHVFTHFFAGPGAKIVISMGMNGVVDVSAPLPNREYSLQMLDRAREVIERFGEAEAPPMRAFPSQLAG